LKKKKSKEEEEPEGPIDPKLIWWSTDELGKIELEARYMVRESQMYQEEVVCTILYNKSFMTAQHIAKTVGEDELEERLKDVRHHANSLDSWTYVGNSRRGLEPMVSDKGTWHTDNSRLSVLNLQKELKDATPPPSFESLEAALARRYQDLSRASRIMARMMGHADAESLAKAAIISEQHVSLPEPTHLIAQEEAEERFRQQKQNYVKDSRRKSLLKPLKKVVKKIFHRRGGSKHHDSSSRSRSEQAGAHKEPSSDVLGVSITELDYGDMGMQ
jgi:hypothetical protein